MAQVDHDISSVLQATWQTVADEVRRTPLSFWNESVFRFYFARTLVERRIDCSVEWRRFDLLVQGNNGTSLIEFKFYCRRRRRRKLREKPLFRKGRASKKNFDEFCECVEKLADIDTAKWFIKEKAHIDHRYLILAYSAQPFGDRYDSIKLPPATKQLARLEPVLALDGLHCRDSDAELKCKLLEVKRRQITKG